MSQTNPSQSHADDPRPVLIYDGHCRFCIQQASRLERWVNGGVRMESFRDPGVIERYPGLTLQQCDQALQLVEPNGRIHSGAEAIATAFRLRPVLAPIGWLYYLPVVRQIADWGYRLVARNRFSLQGDVCTDDACRQHRP
jgi:predicted DCC family thiol-disulfide oxidoreductase YuxK